MDIIDIAIAKSKSGAIDPSDISSAVSDYLDEHGVQVETDTTLSVAGASADSKAVGDSISAVTAYGTLTQEQIETLAGLVGGTT